LSQSFVHPVSNHFRNVNTHRKAWSYSLSKRKVSNFQNAPSRQLPNLYPHKNFFGERLPYYLFGERKIEFFFKSVGAEPDVFPNAEMIICLCLGSMMVFHKGERLLSHKRIWGGKSRKAEIPSWKIPWRRFV